MSLFDRVAGLEESDPSRRDVIGLVSKALPPGLRGLAKNKVQAAVLNVLDGAFEMSWVPIDTAFEMLYEPYEGTYVRPNFKISRTEFNKAIKDLIAANVLKKKGDAVAIWPKAWR
jgi:hypothetical protein